MMNKGTEKAVASAEGAALLRAAGTLGPEKDFPNPDHLAHLFLSSRYKRFLKLYKLFPGVFHPLLEHRAPGIFWHVYSRTLYLDNALVNAVRDGIEQVVILGAGYDTRFYRFNHLLQDISCFEMDLPATQAAKLKLLQRAGKEKPENLVYIPIDFAGESLREVLLEHGYNPALRSLFIWEGVIMYLPEKAVVNVFAFVRQNSAKGSRLAFDYLPLSTVNETNLTGYGVAELVAHSRKLNEPFLFGFEPSRFDTEMEKLGFRTETHLSPQDIRSRFLKGLGSKGHPPNVDCAYLATVESV